MRCAANSAIALRPTHPRPDRVRRFYSLGPLRRVTLRQMNSLFPKQIQRLSYFFRLFACCCASALIGVFLGLLGRVAPTAFNSPLLKPLLWLFAIAWYCYVLGFVLAPRLRDIGISPYIALAAFLPGVNLVIGLIALFAPTGWWLRFNRPTQSAYDAMVSQLRKR